MHLFYYYFFLHSIFKTPTEIAIVGQAAELVHVVGEVDRLRAARVPTPVIGQYHVHVVKHEAVETFPAGKHETDVHQLVFVELALAELNISLLFIERQKTLQKFKDVVYEKPLGY